MYLRASEMSAPPSSSPHCSSDVFLVAIALSICACTSPAIWRMI